MVMIFLFVFLGDYSTGKIEKFMRQVGVNIELNLGTLASGHVDGN